MAGALLHRGLHSAGRQRHPRDHIAVAVAVGFTVECRYAVHASDVSDPGSSEQPATLATRVREYAAILAPTTVLTALLGYFGAVYTDGRLAYYGIQLGLADLTTFDLVLYGTEVMYVPAVLLLLIVVAALSVHAVISRFTGRPHQRMLTAFIAATLAVSGVIVTARAVIGIVVPNVSKTEATGVTPLALAAGPLLLAYAGRMAGFPSPGTPRKVTAGVIAALTVISLFWAANRFAFALGLSRSYDEISDRSAAYMVVLDTKESLAELPDGVTEAPLKGEFKHRYRGFRLVLESGGRLFLAPASWTQESRTVVLPYDDSVRIQVIPPPKNLAPQ